MKKGPPVIRSTSRAYTEEGRLARIIAERQEARNAEKSMVSTAREVLPEVQGGSGDGEDEDVERNGG